MEANIGALETRQPAHSTLARYVEVAKILTGQKDATARDGARWASELVATLNIPGFSTYGMSEENFPEAVEKTMKANSFKGNPVPLNEKELRAILEKAL